MNGFPRKNPGAIHNQSFKLRVEHGLPATALPTQYRQKHVSQFSESPFSEQRDIQGSPEKYGGQLRLAWKAIHITCQCR